MVGSVAANRAQKKTGGHYVKNGTNLAACPVSLSISRYAGFVTPSIATVLASVKTAPTFAPVIRAALSPSAGVSTPENRQPKSVKAAAEPQSRLD